MVIQPLSHSQTCAGLSLPGCPSSILTAARGSSNTSTPTPKTPCLGTRALHCAGHAHQFTWDLCGLGCQGRVPSTWLGAWEPAPCRDGVTSRT